MTRSTLWWGGEVGATLECRHIRHPSQADRGDLGIGIWRVWADVGAGRPIALATGEAGTVYLCHPLLIHAAQKHRGTAPRFMSQPPLAPATALALERSDGPYSPVELAIRAALQG